MYIVATVNRARAEDIMIHVEIIGFSRLTNYKYMYHSIADWTMKAMVHVHISMAVYYFRWVGG